MRNFTKWKLAALVALGPFDLRARDCLKEPRGGSSLPGLRIELALAPVGRLGDEVAAPGSSTSVVSRPTRSPPAPPVW